MIAVTGSNGFIGRRLLSYLADSGYPGLAVSRRCNQTIPKNWESVGRDEFLNIKSKFQYNVLIHLEAKHHVTSNKVCASAEFHQVNVEGTQIALDAAGRAGCKGFIYFSSVKAVQPTFNIATEQGLKAGETQYGRSKWDAEKSVDNWVRTDPSRWAIILRPAVVYGPGNTANIFSMLDAVARRRFLLVNAGQNVKSVVSLENVCAAVGFLLAQKNTGIEVFNVTDSQPVTVKVLAEYMALALGVPSPSKTLPLVAAKSIANFGDVLDKLGFQFWPLNTSRLAGLTENCYFSPEKILKAGYCPVETTRQGIERLADWYKSINRSA